MKKAIHAALVGATAAALTMAGMSTAQAGEDGYASAPGVSGKFTSYGDKFTLCDDAYDLMQVYLDYRYWRKDGSLQEERHYLATGWDTCTTWDHDFGEGRLVLFQVCVDNPVVGVPDLCSTWKRGIA
ncbi:hypothetical protein DMH12_27690 [Streptomyces sp. WAC 04229]|uniref:hypothetical protein n=1 Tax=Streptomyces sp. WAC 04229 TaxID=2203206 RepID=UPI000F7419D6|nr:hypothetical protein [Streptomyces sp. WAC 04229]RSN48234.1 hypothetical protein DMH12_27690 [Streptomyces sp. WAC 04229]